MRTPPAPRRALLLPPWARLSLVALAPLAALLLLRPAATPSPARAAAPAVAATPTATAVAEQGLCTMEGVQEPADDVVERGQLLEMRLRLSADCPEESRGRADIYLLVDRSASMNEAGKFEAAQLAARQFVENIDFARHRVGVVPFSDSASVDQTLTDDPDRLVRALERIDAPFGGTNIAAAIELADRELTFTGRTEAVSVIVLLTDGRQSSEASMIAAAENAAARGVVLFAIGLGADAASDTLRRIAASPDHYYYAPAAEDLAEVYARIAEMILSFTVTDVRVFDQLARGVQRVPGPFGEPRREGLGPLTWWRPFLTPEETRLVHGVRLGRIGPFQPSDAVWVEYTDGDGVRRRSDITPAQVQVIAPSVYTLFLPTALRDHCYPAERYADVVLAIDASASMQGEKIESALAGARAFLDILGPQPGGSQAAIVRYDREASLVWPLTDDRAALDAALAGIRTGAGTRLDRGLATAIEELEGPRRRSGHRPVIVLLSDGRQVEARLSVGEMAEYARLVGITSFAVGLGTDVDREVLNEVAGSPARVFVAPDAADLESIYRQVAGEVRCR